MIFNDTEILDAVAEKKLIIDPFRYEYINPASYDLHIGRDFWVSIATHVLDPRSEQSIRENFRHIDESEILVSPGEFLLGSSVETITIPDDCVGVVCGKSSSARLGWAIENAGYIDPGFSGQITFEIVNQHKSPNILYEMMPFAQVYFVHMNKKSHLPYYARGGSKYQNQKGATLSRSHLNTHVIPF